VSGSTSCLYYKSLLPTARWDTHCDQFQAILKRTECGVFRASIKGNGLQ
jgi:hypothetical protein